MKKAILVMLWLLLSLILPACKTPTYDEIEAEARHTGDSTRLDYYERRRELAEEHFTNKAICDEIGRAWYCPAGAAAKEHRQSPNARQIMRDYNQERWARCGCITQMQLHEVMREFQRQLSRQ